MRKFKRVVAVLTAVIIAAATIPTALLASGIQAGSSDYIIWQASTNWILADYDGKVNADISEGAGTRKYDTFKKADETGSYYSTDFAEEGNGSPTNLAIINSGINTNTLNFGWLNNNKVLNALAPYLYVAFDYRVKGNDALPVDTILTLNASQTQNGIVAELAKVNVADAEDWKEYPITKINATAFAKSWSTGDLSYTLTSATGGLSGTQTVDIKNVILVLKSNDKTNINQALNKISGIGSIENFTKGVYVGTGSRKDYFKLFENFDETTAQSGRAYAGAYKVSMVYPELCDIALSRTLAAGSDDKNFSDAVTVKVRPVMNYTIKKILVTATDGTPIASTTVKRNSEYTFNMPPQDVTVTAEVVYEEERDIAFLWKNDPGTYHTNPWYSNSGGEWKLVDGGNTSAYEFTISNNQGVAYVYGTNNVSITVARYFDTAYLYTSLKLVTESENRTVRIGITGDMYYDVEVPDSEELVPVKIPLKDIATSATFEEFKIDLTNRQAGDVITVGETVVFNKEIEGTVDESWAKIYDISHYEKSETNTLLGLIGDTEGAIDPWCENLSTIGTVVGWDIAWYYSFQNIAPYILVPKEDKKGEHYFTTFYSSEPIDVSECVDTGYLEFFIYSDTDGIEVPFSVEAGGHAKRTYAPFSVIYDKSKTRDDGYMRVRIPFTYLADAGLNMDQIVRITLKGNQTSLFCDFFLISSFRFYDKYADVPEPEPIVYPEPEPERDLPLELDEKIINAKLDKENMTLYVPENTQVWEILSALTFDTDESNVEFFDSKSIDDDEKVLEETVLTESMSLLLYRRGYFVNRFAIKILATETTQTNIITVEYDSEGDFNEAEGDEYTEYKSNQADTDEDIKVNSNQDEKKEDKQEDQNNGASKIWDICLPLLVVLAAIVSIFATIVVIKKLKK